MKDIRTVTASQVERPVGGPYPSLKATIDENTILDMPKVVEDSDTGMLRPVTGRKRILMSLFYGGYSEIQVEVIPADEIDPEIERIMNLTSNHSQTLNLMVDPWHLRDLIDGNKELEIAGRPQREVAKSLGMSEGKASQLMSVFKLHALLQDKVQAGLMKTGAIRMAQRLPKAQQIILGKQDGAVTTADVKKLINEIKEAVAPETNHNETEPPSADENPQGLLIAMEKLDKLKMGLPIEVEIDGQTITIQVVS